MNEMSKLHNLLHTALLTFRPMQPLKYLSVKYNLKRIPYSGSVFLRPNTANRLEFHSIIKTTENLFAYLRSKRLIM